MNKENIRKITRSAVTAAVVFVVTWLVRIPIPGTSGGYVNLGDVIIYVAAFILGGPIAAAAAAVGSALADTAAGAAIYIPATFIIKGLMGLTVGLLCTGKKFTAYSLACILGGAIMTAGYGLYELAVFGASYALASLPYNLIQWAGSVIVAVVVFPALNRVTRTLHGGNTTFSATR